MESYWLPVFQFGVEGGPEYGSVADDLEDADCRVNALLRVLLLVDGNLGQREAAVGGEWAAVVALELLS
jgi:hypothetical protein